MKSKSVNRVSAGDSTSGGAARYGFLFEAIVGRAVGEFDSISDIEKAIEEKRGHPLRVAPLASSGLVSRGGNIFPYEYGLFNGIDEAIDKVLARVTNGARDAASAMGTARGA